MRAFQFEAGKTVPVEVDIPIPIPGEGEVLVKVLAAGICHSDVTILFQPEVLAGFETGARFTMGHEGAGVIETLGAGVAHDYPELQKGTYIAVHCVNSCFASSCSMCSEGRGNLCQTHSIYGLGIDGAWADYMVIRASAAVPVPGDPTTIPPAVVAVATDAVLTPYHALKTIGVRERDTVLIMGLGGLGLNAVQIAKNCMGAKCLIACDLREHTRKEALQVGADYAVAPEELAGLIQSKKFVVDIALDAVGVQPTFDSAVTFVKPGGKVGVIGLGSEKLQFRPISVVGREVNMIFTFAGKKEELAEALQGVADGKIAPRVDERALKDCPQVLEEFYKGQIRHRAVLIP
ncbi:alcohol dehydogenase [Panus rudis PR-1116 ss-1]|nr:alcohol dehydogenase [Panus rudis PR-1116 ss-1]